MKKIINKKIIIILIMVCVIAFLIILIKNKNNTYKILDVGNNSSTNITLDEIEQYIFNIKNYSAKIEVIVESNKNTNQYIIEQIHENSQDIQKIIEPINLAGVEMIYTENKLEIKNSQLGLNKIYNDYPYIENNDLWLNNFINECKECCKENKKINEKDEYITIDIKSEKQEKKLFINKNNRKIEKLTISNNSKKNKIYIIYNEITLNF